MPAMHRLALPCAALLALFTLACDASPAPTDAGEASDASEDGGPDSCVPTLPIETGDPEGHPDPLGAGAGEARAGRLDAAQLPADRTGLALIEAGDFVLANDRVAIVIEAAGESDLYWRYGGYPIGVARVEGGALVEAADFGELLFGLGGHLLATERVGVVEDGSDGGAAVVRAAGVLEPVDFVGDLIPATLLGTFGGWPAAIEYRLDPDTDRVQVTVLVDVPDPRGERVNRQLAGFVQRYRMGLWTETNGFASWMGEQARIAFDDPYGTSYAWQAPAGQGLSPLYDNTGVTIVSWPGLRLEGCARTPVEVGSIVVGRGLNGVQASIWRSERVAMRSISGTVREADGTPARGVRVHVTRADGTHLSRGFVDDEGSFSFELPDEDVQLWAYRRDVGAVGPTMLARGTATANLTLPALGTIEVEVVDDASGSPLPARVQVLPASGEAPRPPAEWGELAVTWGRWHVEFAGADGRVAVRVPPGRWRVIVSRGYEYELVQSEMMVAAGETTRLQARLVHSVDTTGVLCADYHIHTSRSPDSPDDGSFKVLALVADGLELPVRSDHEFVATFEPVVRELGLEAFALGLGGEELTTFAYGHFGVFPLVPDPEQRNGSAPYWPGRLAPELFAELRARPESPAIIINHPRSGGSFGGYFTAAGYDPATGRVGRMELWDELFSAVEVFNDSDFEANRDSTVRDWFSLLNGGRRVFAVGSSDSHLVYGTPVGYPRTCLALGTDDPRAVDADDVRDATTAGRSYVSGGIYLDVRGPGGVQPGGEASGAGERASIEVVVRAATWIDVDALEVIVDGATTETIPIGPDDADPTDATIRLAQTLEVPVAASGSWVVLVASGTDALEPVHPGRRPFAVSNPIFLRR